MNRFIIAAVVGIGLGAEVQAQPDLNTARDVSYMSEFEKQGLHQINMLRNDPAHYLANNFASAIAENEKLVSSGIKRESYYLSTVNGKTDTVRYDENVRIFNQFSRLQKELEKYAPLPPIIPDEQFAKATGTIEGSNVVNAERNGYWINNSTVNWRFQSAPPTFDARRLIDVLYSTTSDAINGDVVNCVLAPDKRTIIAVHLAEEKGEEYPFHLYLTLGMKLGVANLIIKQPIEGFESDGDQFVEPLGDGVLVIGHYNIVKLSSDNKIAWRLNTVAKDSEINSYVHLADGGLVFGGWVKSSGKNNLWLFKVDPSGKKIWDKKFPVKDGAIVAMVEDKDRKGIWAVQSIYKSKKEFDQYLQLYGSDGGARESYFLCGNLENPKISSALARDIRVFQQDDGYTVFGLSSGRSFFGLNYRMENGSLTLASMIDIESEITDPDFSNCVVARKGDTFYAAYESKTDNRNEDYRLVEIGPAGEIDWVKDLGGDQMDGVTSMLTTSDGNLVLAGFSYSGISGEKSEPAFERDHCDVWVIKVDANGRKIWDKTITGPGCILNARLFEHDGKIGVVYKEESSTMIAMIEEK